MPWFKVDDTLHGHPKVHRAGLKAMGMWVLGGSYAASYVTEGFVPEWWVAGVRGGRRLAAQLVAAGLWMPFVKDGEDGWIFHDWNKFQPSHAEIKANRAAASERQRRWRIKHRDAVAGRFAGNGNGVSNGVTNTTPTRPDPTRPVKSSSLVETANPNRPVGDARVARRLDLP